MNENNIYKQESKKKIPNWFYWVIFILPILFLIFLEISLRFFNYGNDYKEWIDLNERFEILNPEIAKKYFSNIENIPFSSESFLVKSKPENSFRVIALGGSSGAGYPYQNSGSFTKYVRKALELSFPEKKIEVANISMAAINSYTILDLLPKILEKKPDLILMYLGHNEYYGVLGAASNQSFASSIFLTNLILKLKEFRITQLLTNFLTGASKIITTNKKISDGTLMSQIAKEKLIGMNSSIFNKGLEQFESNLSDILELCSDQNVPVIIGTLVSNLRDLEPFNNVDDNKNPKADFIFEKAEEKLVAQDLQKADSLFRYAKDLDGLRFRAPEIFNNVISNLAAKYNCEIANIDSFINSQSKFGIVGNDLIVDHLHPNLKGYQLFGKLFYEKIIKSNKIALGKSSLNSYSEVEKLVEENFNFTKYDSTIADFRVKLLKNDWPFTTDGNRKDKSKLLNIANFEDSIALNVLENKISRLDARLKLAEHYYSLKDLQSYVKELLALSEEFPIDNKILDEASAKLINAHQYNYVGNILERSYKIIPNVFNAKWLGIMNLSNNNNTSAIKYLEESKSLFGRDTQVLFNLTGAYMKAKNYNLAYQNIINCLVVDPNYSKAQEVKNQLEQLMKSK